MIKRLLSLTFVASIVTSVAFAQCTPIPSTPVGFFPDPNQGQNMTPGDPNQSYSQVFNFKVPKDTTVNFQGFPVDAEIDSVHFDDITGLPNGLSYSCSNTDCYYDSLEVGCIDVSGTINDTVGTYEVTVMVTFYGTALGGTVATEQAGSLPFATYQFAVGNVGVQDHLNLSRFEVVQNYPNPFEKETLISFSSPTNATYDFNVYNVLGELIKTKKIKAEQGLNQFTFASENYPSGVYVYSLSDANNTITKRMIIK